MVVCGLYMGDDFENAFLIAYGLDHWASLRALSARNAAFDIWQTAPPDPSWHKKARIWLSGHSVAYQLIFHGPLVGFLHGDDFQIRNASRLNPSAVTLSVPGKHILDAFSPKPLLRNLDQASEGVREGMRITFELLKQMKEICARERVELFVVVIPTKESDFSNYLVNSTGLPLHDFILKLIDSERQAREKTFQFLTAAAIPYVNPLPGMCRSLDSRLCARSAMDMHPNRNGYRVIAEAVFSA